MDKFNINEFGVDPKWQAAPEQDLHPEILEDQRRFRHASFRSAQESFREDAPAWHNYALLFDEVKRNFEPSHFSDFLGTDIKSDILRRSVSNLEEVKIVMDVRGDGPLTDEKAKQIWIKWCELFNKILRHEAVFKTHEPAGFKILLPLLDDNVGAHKDVQDLISSGREFFLPDNSDYKEIVRAVVDTIDMDMREFERPLPRAGMAMLRPEPFIDEPDSEKQLDIETALTLMFDGPWKEILHSLLPANSEAALPLIRVSRETTKLRSLATGQSCGNFAGSYSEGLGRNSTAVINIYIDHSRGLREFVKTLLHEFGHARDLGLNYGVNEKILAKIVFLSEASKHKNECTTYPDKTLNFFDDRYTSKKSLSAIRRSIEEDFAETVAYFFVEPELLQKRNPERYAAMVEICENIWRVDYQLFQERIKKLVERPENERYESGVLTDRVESGRVGVGELFEMFPTISMRCFESVYRFAPPNTVSEFKTNANGVVVDWQRNFNSAGRLESEISGGRTFVELVAVDNFNRPTEYRVPADAFGANEEVTLKIVYDSDSEIPSAAHIVMGGVPQFDLTYLVAGDSVIESVKLVSPEADSLSYQNKYLLDTKNKRVEKIVTELAGVPIFKQQYLYSDDGNFRGKQILTRTDKILLESRVE